MNIYDDVKFSKAVKDELNKSGTKALPAAARVARELFLLHGYVSHPLKDYHLEIRLGDELDQPPETVAEVLTGNGFPFHVSGKRLYIKKHALIADFLTFIGADTAAAEYINAQIYRETSGRIERTQNFLMSNMNKTADAVARISSAIDILKTANKFDNLSIELRMSAETRADNPEMSLKEIADLLGVSKSTLNRRIRNILELADTL
ncbi:MAG: DNA-binding protein WhiA [Oscillospiraceae bacterium]|jgi:DNA-binding protein WhiA|nr:DNA-binding protein WhiA [Oscillospiraceae bacterium]